MKIADPEKARAFAIRVARQLREAGFEALWAGGCVRDQLLGRVPKDYDVATSATPDEIRQVFGHHRTLSIGAAFGVITVLGPRDAGDIEVATFRCDAQYSDGRHPDHVTFSTAEEDAKRRDFTINGVFFDPLENRVIDYVGGQRDLERQVIRAIGDPYERIAEDKLRMLRGVRFASTFGFELDSDTHTAIRARASDITIVSAERIAAELRRMLEHAHRAAAVQLLADTGLLVEILPEMAMFLPDRRASEGEHESASCRWRRTLQILKTLVEPGFAVALAGLLRELHPEPTETNSAATGRDRVRRICRRWKLSNDEMTTVVWTLDHEPWIRQAPRLPWSQLQPILINPQIEAALHLAAAVVEVLAEEDHAIQYCRTQLARPAAELNPEPLINGNDLKNAGIPSGPVYASLLREIRSAQLDGRMSSKAEALQHAQASWKTHAT